MIQYSLYKEQKLFGRYVTNKHIEPVIEAYKKDIEVEVEGVSVEKKSIYSLKIGTGKKKVLAWSQMHGNESTTTKAVFDFLNFLKSEDELASKLRSECVFCVIPILNPDGADRYTRFNANEVDLNRDAQQLSQPESKVLRNIYDSFKPDYCFNLHGQRTIFSAGYSSNSSVMSFLSPAEDEQRAVTKTRKIAMQIITAIGKGLNSYIPDQVARYDDGYNVNCVGDTFQGLQTPTLLFEAGHYPDDYKREKTREMVFYALFHAVNELVFNEIEGSVYQGYFKLPENQKLFYDVIIRNVIGKFNELMDVAIQYEEKLIEEEVRFLPKVVKVGDLTEFFGHKEIDGGGYPILINNSSKIVESLSIISQISINGENFVKKIEVTS